MTGAVDPAGLHRLGFLTLPNYSMIACANALEACRMANYVSGHAAYRWHVAALDAMPVPASNGLSLTPTLALDGLADLDALFVCGGILVRQAVDRRLKDALRRLARRGVVLGALCTGSFALAEAGLLDGYRCAIHWENLAAIREEFPEIAFTGDLFVIDRARITCTGGIAPLDLMLTLIAARLGRDIAARVSDQFILARHRPGDQRQLAAPAAGHAALDRVTALMAGHVETPLAIADLARRAGLSVRQLERLFKHHLGTGPAAWYAGLRLARARELLRQTAMPVTDIGLACGFPSAAHFSTVYSRHFGHSPRAERRP